MLVHLQVTAGKETGRETEFQARQLVTRGYRHQFMHNKVCGRAVNCRGKRVAITEVMIETLGERLSIGGRRKLGAATPP